MIYIHLVDQNGIYLPDAVIDTWADGFVATTQKLPDAQDLRIDISQDLILTAIRVRIKKGEIPHSRVVIVYEDQHIAVDRYGCLSDYPKWCYRVESYLLELLS